MKPSRYDGPLCHRCDLRVAHTDSYARDHVVVFASPPFPCVIRSVIARHLRVVDGHRAQELSPASLHHSAPITDSQSAVLPHIHLGER
jgi:hypothetical protein